MEYRALTIGLTDELFSGIQPLLIAGNVRLTPSLTVRDAGRLLTQEAFHLLIVDLDYLRSIGQVEWLTGIRRISFIPVIILSNTPEQDLHSMVQLARIYVFQEVNHILWSQIYRLPKCGDIQSIIIIVPHPASPLPHLKLGTFL